MSKKTDEPKSASEFAPQEAEQQTLAAIKKEMEEKISSLEELNTNLTTERDKMKDMLLRSKAELENNIKRNRLDVDKAREYGSQKLLEDLIPVVDSLELARKNTAEEDNQDDGIKMILDMLGKVLEKHGVEQINPEQEEFDPQFHEAMTLQPSKEVKPNTILTVLQTGYLLKKRLIRPARVIVAKAVE